ncbi:MAG: hypothetical protein LBH43_18535 [Treponema sp.]|jgi:methyl-accepting chemotaxis protein|nr:hypothetical protein [Treponema sp.]
MKLKARISLIVIAIAVVIVYLVLDFSTKPLVKVVPTLKDIAEGDLTRTINTSSKMEQVVANINSVTKTLVNNAANVKTLQEASEVGRSGLQEVSTDIQEIARESEGLLGSRRITDTVFG